MNDTRQAALADFTKQTQQCRFPGCQTLTLQTYCAKHQPGGDWRISEEVRDEQRREEQKQGHE